MGVNEFNVPARALPIPISAMQNKYAGSKLPNNPDKKTLKSLLAGICLIPEIAMGDKKIPDATILRDATWIAVRLTRPTLIRIKLLPQIKESMKKMSQLRSL